MCSLSAAMCPSDLQQLWKEVSGVPSSEEALKQAEGLDLSTNSSNSTSAFPKAASAHIPLHSLPNGQSHTPKRDRYCTVCVLLCPLCDLQSFSFTHSSYVVCFFDLATFSS